jgi:NADH dehydrogenase
MDKQYIPRRIVIVGGGAGGLELATSLGNDLGRRGLAEITLVDASLTHLWKPLLHEVAAGTLDSDHDEMAFLSHAHRHNFRFLFGAMDGLDRENKKVHLAPFTDEAEHVTIPAREVKYDWLVLSVGSVTNDFGVTGARENCLFLDNRDDADRFQRIILSAYIDAQTREVAPEPGALTVAIVGGGATGVELAAELHHVARRMVAFGFDRIDPDRDVRLALIEATDRLVSAAPERVSETTERELRSLGVAVHTGTQVTEVTDQGLQTKGGEFIPARFVVWTAGIKAPKFLSTIGLETNRVGQIIVERTLQTPGDPDIFALGDCTACPTGVGKRTLPPTAQVASQQAAALYDNLKAKLQGNDMQPFQFKNRGGFVSLSEHTAVGSMMGNLLGKVSGTLMIEGWAARFTYRMIYRKHQLALHGWLRTGLIILSDWLTSRGRSRLKLH